MIGINYEHVAAAKQAGNETGTINIAAARLLQDRFECCGGRDYGILYLGRLALLMQTPQGSRLCAAAMVAWILVICGKQLECAIAIELCILDGWFATLLHVSNRRITGARFGRVAVLFLRSPWTPRWCDSLRSFAAATARTL